MLVRFLRNIGVQQYTPTMLHRDQTIILKLGATFERQLLTAEISKQIIQSEKIHR